MNNPMRIHLILLFTAVSLLALSSEALALAPEPHPWDSVRRDTVTLHFRVSSHQLERDYMDNDITLRRLASLLADSTAPDSVIISVLSSPEGDPGFNRRLSAARAEAVKGYLLWQYPGIDRNRVAVRLSGENWQGLYRMVRSRSYFPNREEILAMMESEPDTGQWMRLLQQMDGGSTWREVLRYFNSLREAVVVISVLVAVEPMREREPVLTAPEEIRAGVRAMAGGPDIRDAAPMYNASERTAVPEALPLIALKTNALTWAGLLPDGRVAAWRPNLGAEVFFARRWSVDIAGEYSLWKGGKDRGFWGISGYSLEPRLWPVGDRRFRWVYVGVYGRIGDFDHQPAAEAGELEPGANSTGRYWSAGLSAGVFIPIGKHLGVEAGIRAGYRDAYVRGYDIEAPHYYWHHDFRSARWGITGLNLSLVYRWNYKKARP